MSVTHSVGGVSYFAEVVKGLCMIPSVTLEKVDFGKTFWKSAREHIWSLHSSSS